MELREIADACRLIEAGYAEALQQRDQFGTAHRHCYEHEPAELSKAAENLAQCEHHVQELRQLFFELDAAVSIHLPDVAPDLKVVGTAQPTSGPDLDRELRTIRGAAMRAMAGVGQEPITYLWNWTEILDAVGLEETPEQQQRRRIRKLNDDYGGPIIVTQTGSTPKVDKAKLIKWWNGLESRFEEIQQRERDRKASVADSYHYGKEGEVIPEIGVGSKRRSDFSL